MFLCKHSCLTGKELEEEQVQQALKLSMLSTNDPTGTAASNLNTLAPSNFTEATNVDADSAMVDAPPAATSSVGASRGKSEPKSKSKGGKSGSSDAGLAQSQGMLINAMHRIAF
jgi:hypothetical protein